MKINCKKTILSIIALSLIPHLSQAFDWNDWVSTDSWKNWAFGTKKNASETKDTQNKAKDESEDEVIDLDAPKVAKEETQEPKVDFYDTLGIKFFPEQYLLGTDATLKKHLTTLFEKKQHRSAVSYFISVERKNHALAISMLESMNPAHRLIILLDSPAKFIAKILVDIRNQDFKGKTLSHWGTYELQSEYFGKKTVDQAEIKGETVSLRYIVFLLSHNSRSKEDYATRAFHLAQILSHASANDLASLLVYTREEATVKMGQQHNSCFGAVKSKGYCDEETVIYLPTEFVGQLLNFMHTNKMISNQDLVTILETEFKANQDRFQAILKKIDIKVLQEIIFNFSDEIHPFLPDDIILNAIPSLEDSEPVLSITNGVNKSTNVIPASNEPDAMEEEL